jgi:4-oxalomesaconate tautomerase
MTDGIPCLWMRGGTSKGAYLLACDLPADPARRDDLLLRLMGSPDPRQIDGLGGGDPLTSKVAILSPPSRRDADVDYLFLQVFVDQALVSDAQGCGNILAAVGPAAIERGLVPALDGETPVRIHMMFQNIAGSMCGALLPSGRAVDRIDGVDCTLIDNGMPCVVMRAADFGLTGRESREVLEADTVLKARVEAIRLKAGPMMNLGDVAAKSVPKMTLVSPPANGGTIGTRSFIPHRAHAGIGVFAAVSVATACTLPGSPAAGLARLPLDGRFLIEHPTGAAEVLVETDSAGQVIATGTLRTARKLMDGLAFPRD